MCYSSKLYLEVVNLCVLQQIYILNILHRRNKQLFGVTVILVVYIIDCI